MDILVAPTAARRLHTAGTLSRIVPVAAAAGVIRRQSFPIDSLKTDGVDFPPGESSPTPATFDQCPWDSAVDRSAAAGDGQVPDLRGLAHWLEEWEGCPTATVHDMERVSILKVAYLCRLMSFCNRLTSTTCLSPSGSLLYISRGSAVSLFFRGLSKKTALAAFMFTCRACW